MKIKLIVFVFLLSCTQESGISLIGREQCKCSEIKLQDDCSSLKCEWKTESSKCIDQTSKNCNNLTTQQSCDDINGCAWTNTGVCAIFTKCSDYTINSIANANQCYLKDQTCVPGATSGSAVQCITGIITCTNITEKTVCSSLSQNTQIICWWSTSCLAQDISKCSTITEQILCKALSCIYEGGKCSAPTCADIKIQNECTYIREDNYGQVQICTWVNNSCANSNDTTGLTKENCYKNTGGTYRWENDACLACSGQSTNTQQLAFLVLLAIILS